MRMLVPVTSVGSGLALVIGVSIGYESGICTKLAHCHVLIFESAKAFAIAVTASDAELQSEVQYVVLC